MASSVCNSSTCIITFLCLTLLLPSTDGLRIMAEGLCVKPSGTWNGACLRNDHCEQQCKEKEGGIDGQCLELKCLCRFRYCGNGTTCVKPSGIWKGPCFNDLNCSRQCKEKENAFDGHCNDVFMCVCVVDC